jgi:hypothetical protein
MTDLAWLYGTKECAFSEGKSELGRVGLYQQAAEAGYPIAQSNYAEYLMEGDLITRKPGLAKEYFHRAMDAGYGNAAVVLGLYYLSAEFLPIDSTKARALFNRADREGADLAELLKLETELNKIEAVGEPEMTEIDGLQELFIGSWGYGYGEARWDYAPKGKFEARVYVGIYDNSKHFYLGMMREANNPVVRLTGVSVEYADESVSSIDLSFCQSDTCRVNQYGDNFGRPGSFITIELPPSKQRGVLEAIKSGSYVVFDYQTQTGPKNYTFSLKGSRKAIETLERKNGLSSANVESAEEPSDAAQQMPSAATVAANKPPERAAKKVETGEQRPASSALGSPAVSCFYRTGSTFAPGNIQQNMKRMGDHHKHLRGLIEADPRGPNVVLHYIWGAIPTLINISGGWQEHWLIIEQRDWYKGATICDPDSFEYDTIEELRRDTLKRDNSRSRDNPNHREAKDWRERIIRYVD